MQVIKIIDKKIKLILISLSFLIIFIICRLFYLQIYISERLFQLSKRNFTRIQKIVSPRGDIVDTNNHILVTNRPVINIYWQGTGNKNLSNEQIKLLNDIEKIIEVNILINDGLINIKNTEKYSKLLLIADDISYDKLGKISEQCCFTENILISTKFKRYYPHKSLFSHIIGYLSQIDAEIIGKMGIEKLFEEDLKGQPGKVICTINSLGKNLNSSEIKSPIPGKTIKTTLDLHLQKIAEQIFPNEFKGSLIIMDPENGAIRALLSKPSFDPNTFLKQLSLKEWNELQEKQPFLNRAFNACYPPASIFKLITITAAIELGIIKQDSIWFCNGHINFVNRNYHCAKQLQGHGIITPKDAIVKSCNTFFYNIAKHIHIDDLADYAKRFGLGQKTGIIFAEKNGLIPTNSWKKKVYGESWWPGETLSAVIGQSYLLVTPIQIARMVSSIFQGYLVTPRILEEEKIEKQNLNIKKDTLDFLKQAMRAVATSGTGQRIGKIKDIIIYAKTGTAQTTMLQEDIVNCTHLDHAWFVSNFSYKNEKPLTMVIFLENAGSTTIAINSAREFLIEYKKLFN